MIKGTYAACKQAGMPYVHARCFQRVANRLNCMIAVRSVGIYATGLIMENYASKGFHVKAKSCDWGPMAGFVLSDPRFSKQGVKGVRFQRIAVHMSFLQGASEIPVYISEQRRKGLEALGCMTRVGGTVNEMVYSAHAPDSGRSLQFILQRKIFGVPGARGCQMWAVCYGPEEVALPSQLSAPAYSTDPAKQASEKKLLPVMALVNPDCPAELRGTYRSAMTGDYDLWGVWPSVSAYSPNTLDCRSIPRSERRASTENMLLEYGHPDFGNVTLRILQIKDALNSAIRATGYAGGDMVHHGDETGHPLAADMQMNFIAFIPRRDDSAWFIESMADYGYLIRECVKDYSVSLNGAWQKALGFTVSQLDSFEHT